jgi:HEAT repeat protein
MTPLTSIVLTAALLPAAAAGQTSVPPVPPAPPAPVAPRVVALPPLPDVSVLDALGVVPMALADARVALEQSRMSLDDLRDSVFMTPGFDFRFDLQEPFGFGTQSDSYRSGKELLNQRKYDDAIVRFDRVVAQKGANADGALYWKAYAQFKLGKTDDALATIAQLRRDHGQSRYLSDAKVLEADTRRSAGQTVNPAEMDDDESKLLALQGVMRADPARAIPAIENVLMATNSLRVKKQALYLLALSTEPRARQILLNYAKGGGNPDVQTEAIRYLVATRDKQQTTSADLMQIYQSTQDVNVRLAVIGALRASGDRTGLYTIASTPTVEPLIIRTSALSSLSSVLNANELWTLYEKETHRDLKLQMVTLFGSLQAVDQLSRIARTDKDADVRRTALRTLGRMKTDKTGALLSDLYGAEQDVETRRGIIQALSMQGNAEALVAIARKEKTLQLKTEIVRHLSNLAPKSKVAADYLMEIIK